MLMLDKAAPITVRESTKVACLAATDTWTPIPHAAVVGSARVRRMTEAVPE